MRRLAAVAGLRGLAVPAWEAGLAGLPKLAWAACLYGLVVICMHMNIRAGMFAMSFLG